jgi:hypothetical protein
MPGSRMLPGERAQDNDSCLTHQRKWRLQADPAGLAGGGRAVAQRWAERQPPFLAAHMFSLAPLSTVARSEMLYVLHRRDQRGQNLSPQAVRGVVGQLAALPNVALAKDAFPDPAQAGYEGTVSLLRGVRWDIATGFDQFRGVDPARKLVWDLIRAFFATPAPSTSARYAMGGWVRELVMHWARTTSPNSKDLREYHWACVVASRALEPRPGGGNDPGKFQFSDVTAVVDAFRGASSRRGDAYAATTRIRSAAQFFDLLDFGRREGVLDGLSPRFVRHPDHHTIKRVDENEEEIGKAIPELVIGQLDRYVHLLGAGMPYGELPAVGVNAMLHTAYVILRDTGRRPAEVAGLDLACLEFDNGEYQLVWHNMKGRRPRGHLVHVCVD